MNTQRPIEKLEELFHRALKLDPAERARLIAQVSASDPELAAELQSLISAHEQESNLVDSPAYQAAASLMLNALDSATPTRMPQPEGDAKQHAASDRSKLSSSPLRDGGRFVTGAILAGRYRIVSLLGVGGMGEVFKAEDLKLNQTVALKFLPEKIALDGGMLSRFHNEVRIARQVTHSNVCRVYDIGEVDGLHFISMEFIDGEDLSSLLRRIGRLPGDKAVELARQLCSGLAAAHDQGVLHRDLKPANVMIDGRGKARITDFGLAVVSENLRGDDVIAGTPAYMSPEQLTGKEVTQRSDIYSLGLVLYELFTGKRVYETQNIHELIELHDKSAPATPSSHVKDIDPLAERVILRCLEKDPKARPASAVQVALALPGGDPLQAALAMGETPSPEMVAAAGEKTGLRPRLAVACLVAIICLLAVYAWGNARVALFANAPLENSAEVLARRGRDFAVRFGYVEKPIDTDYGFGINIDFLSYAGPGGTSGDRSLLSKERLATAWPSVYEYWYRESPVYLLGFKIGGPFSTGRVDLSDPPNDVSGMVGMRLDPVGRLRYFNAVQPQLEQPSEQSAPPAKSFDRDGLFAAAGLNLSSFTRVESQWTPLAICDERAAWTGTYPDQPDVAIRLEAAAYRGKLVYFQIIEPWTRPERMASAQQTIVPGSIRTLFALSVFLAAFALGWRNQRLGKGDRRGAFRLAILAAITFALNWVLSTSHAPIERENVNALVAFSIFSFLGLVTWSMYMSVEPFIRRRLPETIITWSRLLAGQFRDPLVGRDVLIGVLAAVGYRAVNVLVLSWTSTTQTYGMHPDALLDTRHNLGLLVNSFGSWANGVLVLFEFSLLRMILRKEWLAAACVIVINAVVGLIGGDISVVNFSLWLLAIGPSVFLLLRYGLVAGCVYYSANALLVVFPVTTNFSAWYAGSGMFAVAVTVALAGFAFYTSLGGKKLFEGKLLEE